MTCKLKKEIIKILYNNVVDLVCPSLIIREFLVQAQVGPQKSRG